tara:strand:- start:4036 stop:4413 length:378 start_codon:yes stop_codon:yes gene_type:complete
MNHKELMRVKDFWVGIEDHGFTTAFLHLEGDGCGVGFGGYALGRETNHSAACGHFIRKVLEVLGKSSVADCAGTYVWAHFGGKSMLGSTCIGIECVPKGGEGSFFPKEEFKIYDPKEEHEHGQRP